jgi:hypothetical protein
MTFVSTFPVQPLRGLGGLNIEETKSQFESLMRQLVDGVRQRANQMVSEANALTRKNITTITTQVVDNVNQGVNALKKTDAKGVPLFLRKPADAKRLLLIIKENADSELTDLQRTLDAFFFASGKGLAGLLQAFINQLVEALLALLEGIARALGQAFAKFPLGGAILVLGVAIVGYLKFAPKGRK